MRFYHTSQDLAVLDRLQAELKTYSALSISTKGGLVGDNSLLANISSVGKFFFLNMTYRVSCQNNVLFMSYLGTLLQQRLLLLK